MVPTGQSWNVLELQCKGCVPDREGRRGRYIFWSKHGILQNNNMNITMCFIKLLDTCCIRCKKKQTQTAKTTTAQEGDRAVAHRSTSLKVFIQQHFHYPNLKLLLLYILVVNGLFQPDEHQLVMRRCVCMLDLISSVITASQVSGKVSFTEM